MVQDVGMLYSPRVTSCEVIITFYQRTLLGTSANQKRHYLKSYNNIYYHMLYTDLLLSLGQHYTSSHVIYWFITITWSTLYNITCYILIYYYHLVNIIHLQMLYTDLLLSLGQHYISSHVIYWFITISRST